MNECEAEKGAEFEIWTASGKGAIICTVERNSIQSGDGAGNLYDTSE